eukprot:gene18958-20864_t
MAKVCHTVDGIAAFYNNSPCERPGPRKTNSSPALKVPTQDGDKQKSPGREKQKLFIRRKLEQNKAHSVANMVPIIEESNQNGNQYPVVSPIIRKSRSYAENMNNGGYNSDEGDSIKVYVRIRPSVKTLDQDIEHSLCLEATSAKSLVLYSKPEPKQFSYDHVADMNTTQEEVFSTVGKKIIEGCVSGYNGTIFAYGQTGSGKTFTMLGPPDETDGFSHELRGVIPRGFEYMFSLINREQEKHGDRKEFFCKCSFLEIYNEQIFDLLDAASAGLHLREDIKKGVFVEGLQERDIASAKDAYKVLSSGWMNRRVASTSMNRESSRSHAVFTVSIESKERKGGISNIKVSRLHLVDLAGSERQKDTKTEGVRLKEAGNINRSLSALGNVIMALVDIAHGKTRHVHYRDSKLTFILRDSLGGNAKTYIIANIHPSAKCFGETLSTLNFARRAKMIKNKAVINEDVAGNVTELQLEIKKLKELVAQLKYSESDECSSESHNEQRGRSKSMAEDARQWKEMMLSAISEREKVETEKQALIDKVQKLEELCGRKEKFLQSTKMIVKLRESHIAKLERLRKKEKTDEFNEEDTKDREMQLLREEIKILQDKVEHHPDVTRFALENLELRGEVKKYKSKLSESVLNDSVNNEANKAHRYTMQLERQLRDLLAVSIENNSEKSLSSSLQSLEASNAEIERLKNTCAQLESKLDSTQQDLTQSRQEVQQMREELVEKSEISRKKEIDLQSDLIAARKSIAELERTLESHHLKTAVERTAMNDIHMQTIKTLTSPLKFGTPSKLSSPFRSTPLKLKDSRIAANGMETPKKNLWNGTAKDSIESQFIGNEELPSDVSRNRTLERKDSLSDIDDDDDDVNPFIESVNETKDAEEIYAEVLLDELKQLQKVIDEKDEVILAEEAKRLKINQINAKLQYQVNELNELLTNERASWNVKEIDMEAQMMTLKSAFKEEQERKQLFKSEAEDLRILMQSADKDVDALKRARNNDAIEGGRRYASLESKLVKIETNYYNMQSEIEEANQANQLLQTDLENAREELEFTTHKNSELEKIVSIERDKNKDLEGKLKDALGKLEIEIDTNMKLVQEDKQTEVVRAVEEAKDLREQLEKVNNKYESQEFEIMKLTKEIKDHDEEIARLNRVNTAEREVVGSLQHSVQELRASLLEKDGHLEQTKSQLDETKRMLSELTDAYEEKKRKISKLMDTSKEESEKERSQKETEIKLLKEELRTANDQHKELSIALEQQQQQFASLQGELADEKEIRKDFEKTIENMKAKNIETMADYEKRLTDIHCLVQTNDMSLIESQAGEADKLRNKLSEFVRLSEEWEQTRLEKNSVIEELKAKLVSYEELLKEKENYEAALKSMNDQLKNAESDFQQKEISLIEEANQFKELLGKKDKSYADLNVEMKLLKEAKKKTDAELAIQLANVECAQEDNEYMQEELERTRKHEAKVFEEKEEIKSQLSVLIEEKTKLTKDLEEASQKLVKVESDNAKLASHQNLNQKIHYHLNLKKENNQLKEQISKLSSDIVHLKSKIPKS